jgi:hypothetical protein
MDVRNPGSLAGASHDIPGSLRGEAREHPPLGRAIVGRASLLHVDCPLCGWRHYPEPEQNGGPAVEWRTALRARTAGATLPSETTAAMGVSHRMDELRSELERLST